MRHTTKWIALAGLALALLAIGAPASAQTPTPEGTVIKNIATASWTDANNNTYTAVKDSVMLTVGFLAGVDATTITPSLGPGSPSTGNEVTIQLHNIGNGPDSLKLALGSLPVGMTNVTYKIGATPYATLAALNDALAAITVAGADSVAVIIVYDIATGHSGESGTLTVTGSSRRTASTHDDLPITVAPLLANGVDVTPDASPVDRLPSNGTVYSQTFHVRNTSGFSRQIDLVASSTGSAIDNTSLSITGGSSVTLAAGASADVVVSYTVKDVAAGSTGNLVLTGTVNGSTETNDGSFAVTVIRPAVTVTKVALKDDDSAIDPAADKVLPGQYIKYRITVHNGGTADAATVNVTDNLPGEVTYDSHSDDGAGWTFPATGATVTAHLDALAVGVSHYFIIRVKVK